MAGRERVTVRIQGGLGNQLFQYAAARRLALHNDLPLWIDPFSGYARDLYGRKYLLDRFHIRANTIARGASYASHWGRLRRRIEVRINRSRAIADKSYLLEDDSKFDPALLALKVKRPLYLEGYFQFEEYFRDIRDLLLEELTLRTEHDAQNLDWARAIQSCESVCLHVRRLHAVRSTKDENRMAGLASPQQVDASYFDRAVGLVTQRVRSPHFFVFADHPDWAREHVRTGHPTEYVAHNGDEKDYEDFWLMTGCRHFIIGHSTFSWWGAWLSQNPAKVVVAPKEAIGRMLKGVPDSWILA